MFCIHCGAQNSDGASFCNACGKGVAGAVAHKRTDKKLHWLRWVTLAMSVATSLYIGSVALKISRIPTSLKVEADRPTSIRVEVTSPAFIVAPVQWKWFPFKIPTGATLRAKISVNQWLDSFASRADGS